MNRSEPLAEAAPGEKPAGPISPDLEGDAVAAVHAEELLDPNAWNRLEEMAGGDAAFLAELVETFLEDAPQLLADMRQSVGGGDAAGLRLAAHSLKSNSADFGAMELSGMCRELEGMGKAGTLTGAEEKVGQAEAEYAVVAAALEKMRRG
jgi:HPt (histidine-containing phosphotransfer) domain-containing protein